MKTPESWYCVDCGVNTAPGIPGRVEFERAMKTSQAVNKLMGKEGSVTIEINDQSEVYTVRTAVWQKARMNPMGGCLCIGCLEKRIGRQLRPKDFPRNDPFNLPQMPGTPRLLKRPGS